MFFLSMDVSECFVRVELGDGVSSGRVGERLGPGDQGGACVTHRCAPQDMASMLTSACRAPLLGVEVHGAGDEPGICLSARLRTVTVR